MNADDTVLSAESVNAPVQRAVNGNELPRGFWIGLRYTFGPRGGSQ